MSQMEDVRQREWILLCFCSDLVFNGLDEAYAHWGGGALLYSVY